MEIYWLKKRRNRIWKWPNVMVWCRRMDCCGIPFFLTSKHHNGIMSRRDMNIWTLSRNMDCIVAIKRISHIISTNSGRAPRIVFGDNIWWSFDGQCLLIGWHTSGLKDCDSQAFGDCACLVWWRANECNFIRNAVHYKWRGLTFTVTQIIQETYVRMPDMTRFQRHSSNFHQNVRCKNILEILTILVGWALIRIQMTPKSEER